MSTEEVASIGIGMQTDGVERGIKALDVLASKGPIVEKSMGQVEGAAKRTGKSLETLGRGTALDGLAQTSATAAAGMEKLGASSGKAQAALSGQATAAKSAVSSFDSLKSAVAGFSQTESQYIQKLVDEAKQIGMTRAERERYIAQSRGMSESAQQVAAAIGAKIDAYKREQTELGKTAGATKDSAQSMLAMARTGVAAFLGGAVVQGAMSASKAMFDASASAERLRTMLDFSTGGNSAREIEYLRGVTQRLGLEFSTTAKAYGQFQAAAKGTALEGDKARAVFESVAKASAVMGLSADQSSGVLLALQQMISKGTVQAEELRGQLGERLPGAFQIAAKAMGVTTGELGKMLEQGQVVADDFLPKFAKALEANIGDASEKAAGRLDASVNRVASAWDRLKQNAGDTGASKFMAGQYEILADGLTGVSQAMERARLSGSGFFGQIGSGAVAVARFVNPLQAFSYSAIETGNALKQAEAEFAALQARGAANTKNIYLQSSYFQLQEYIKELKAAQAEQAKLTGGAAGNPNMNAGVTASGQARERFEKQRAADLEAANAFRLNQSGVPASYLKDMAELIRLNQAGVIVGKEYTDALAKQQDLLLKKTTTVKGSAAAANAEQNAYESLTASIRAKITENEAEISGAGRLTESDKLRIKLLEELNAGSKTLTAAHKAQALALLEKLSAQEREEARIKGLVVAYKQEQDIAEEIAQAYVAQSKAREDGRAGVNAYVNGIEESNRALQLELSLMGESEQSRAIALEQYRIELDLKKQIAAIDANTGFDEAQREEERAKARAAAAIATANASSKAFLDEWKGAVSKYDDIFRQGFADMLNNGKDGWKSFTKSLATTFKTTVADTLYKAFAQPFVVRIVGQLLGLSGAMGLSGAAQAGQGMSAIGAAGNLFSAGSALGGLGAVGGALSGFTTAATASIQSLVGMSGTVAQMTTSLAAAGHTAASGVSAGVQAFQAIPGWGWAIAGIAALAAIFSKKATPHAGGASTYSEAGGLVSSADIYRSSGLADTRTYNAEISTALTGNVAKAIGDTLNATAKAFGQTAGYEITTAFADDTSKDGAWGSLIIKQMGEAVLDWRDTQTSKWAPREFADGEAGSKEYLAEVAKSARDALVQAIGDVDWATDMLKGLGESVSLESLAQTVQQINAAQAAFDALGKNIVGFGALTDGAISQLVKAAGSIDGLVSAASAYYDNFYSEAEKTASVTLDVAAALADVGLQMPTTREEFRALVESQMALGDAGTDAVAALLGVSGAFASVTAASETAADAAARLADEQGKAAEAAARAAEKAAEEAARRAEEIARERYGLETQIMQLLGDTAGLRMREIEALDASNRALQEHIYAIEDARAAYDKSIASAQSAYGVLESSIGTDRSALQSALDAERDAITARYKLQQDGHAAQLSAAQSAADKMRGIASMLSGALGRLVVESPALDRARLQSARGVIGAAAASSNVMAPGLESALSVVTDDVRKLYGKWEDFAFDQGVTAGQTAALSSAAQSQLTGYESIVNALKSQDDVTKLLADAEMAAAQERFDSESKKLDERLEQGKSMLDRLLGIEEGTLSSVEALARLTDAVNAGNAALQAQRAAEAAARMAATQGETLRDGFKEIGGYQVMTREQAEAFASGLTGTGGKDLDYSLDSILEAASQYGKSVIAGGEYDRQALWAVAGEMQRVAELEAWLKSMGRIDGSHAGGLTYVPFDGYRAELHKGERVLTQDEARVYTPPTVVASMLRSGGASDGEILAELRAMRQRLEAIEAASNATAGATVGTKRALDRVVDSDALRTRETP